MPELPEVETMARDLAAVISGRRIKQAWLDTPKIVNGAPTRLLALSGTRAVAVRRRAKTILIDLDDGTTIGMAPRMTGAPRLAVTAAPHGKHDLFGLVFEPEDTQPGFEMRWHDPRRFGRLGRWQRTAEGLRDEQGLDPFAAIGPEPLELGPAGVASTLAGSRGGRNIKALLLDQETLAGVGNIYADEALFAAGIDPRTMAAKLRPEEFELLGAAVVRLLQAGIAARGAKIISFASPGGEAGMQHQLLVYGQGGLPCHRCRTILEHAVVAGRGTTWCPRCQS